MSLPVCIFTFSCGSAIFYRKNEGHIIPEIFRLERILAIALKKPHQDIGHGNPPSHFVYENCTATTSKVMMWKLGGEALC